MKGDDVVHANARTFSSEDVAALLEQGLKQKEIAVRLGVKPEAVSMRVKRDGLNVKVKRELFTRLWSCGGITVREIGDWLGCSQPTVRAIARRFDLPDRMVHLRKVPDAEFRDMWLARVASKDIARYFQWQQLYTVTKTAKRLGLSARKPGPWLPLAQFLEQRLGERMQESAEQTRRHGAALWDRGGGRK